MQCVNLKNDLATIKNQCQFPIGEELESLQKQVTDLNRNLLSLENTIKAKDVQLENAHRDNQRLSAELNKQKRSNRNIKQQLADERHFYQREKDYFSEEIERRERRCVNDASKLQRQQRKEIEEARDNLEEENKSLRAELTEKCQTTYNLCIKFLRMKHAKDTLRQKLDQLLNEHLRVLAEMMEELDEARRELNIIVSDKFREPLPLSKAKFLQILQRNTRLIHENVTLKVQIQHLTRNVEKLKCCAQKPKLINVDAKLIAKLVAQSRKKYGKECSKWPPLRSNTDELNFEAAKLTMKISLGDSKRCANTNVREIQTGNLPEVRMDDAHSAPEVADEK